MASLLINPTRGTRTDSSTRYPPDFTNFLSCRPRLLLVTKPDKRRDARASQLHPPFSSFTIAPSFLFSSSSASSSSPSSSVFLPFLYVSVSLRPLVFLLLLVSALLHLLPHRVPGPRVQLAERVDAHRGNIFLASVLPSPGPSIHNMHTLLLSRRCWVRFSLGH